MTPSNNVVAIRFKVEDKEILRQRAREVGLDMASLARTIILQQIKNPEVAQE